tara:strand:- start:331 stop:558 length:228 start_codon:yes stop_codon:yes gene_type:complete
VPEKTTRRNTHKPWNVFAQEEVKERLNELVDKYRKILTSTAPGAKMPVATVLQQALETAIYTATRGATVHDPEHK